MQIPKILRTTALAAGLLAASVPMIDGEAIVCDENGLAVFDLIRRHGALASAVHCAFDLLELDGKDLAASRSSGARRCWPSCCAARL